jgi:small RNA 2'-O-methyltransferase
MSALHDDRLEAAAAAIRAAAARRVLDIGCGDGRLVARLLDAPDVLAVTGLDPDPRKLAAARARLADEPRARFLRGAAEEVGAHLGPVDAAALVETIEHVPPDRLSAVAAAVLGRLAPRLVVITTPNRDFNARLGVPAHRLRHRDHRFEWGRARFRAWIGAEAARHGYAARFEDVPALDPILGGPSQMALLTRRARP